MIAKEQNQIDKVYEQGEEIGFMIKGDETFYELDEEYGYCINVSIRVSSSPMGATMILICNPQGGG
jgi:hypothetical protein